MVKGEWSMIDLLFVTLYKAELRFCFFLVNSEW